MSERMSEGDEPPSAVIPEFARPLVDMISAAHVYPSWDLTPGEWLTVHALIIRSGIDMLAAVAVAAGRKADVSHARYFLRAWQSRPPKPAEGTTPPPTTGADVIPLAGRTPQLTRSQQAAQWYAEHLAKES
ncbi:hypothetical protein ACFQ61_02005 [Streptomyces sp. NPDC056500]|uniref:hypothetical protein n=1 Tax=Streptomyces sp. NPDC056500 TaxID=3345840 RepID=UPI00368D5D9E